jgi:Fic family protein
MSDSKTPPYTRTARILKLVAEICLNLGRHAAQLEKWNTPRLRRINNIRSIHASLAIENNTLTLEQVTDVIEGKTVWGPPGEIQEVKNAFAAYKKLSQWNATASADLLEAHALMMNILATDAGHFRSRGVGVFRGKEVVHMAPPADRVPWLIEDLFSWLKTTDEHPLVAACVFHYEFEFIHPFSDGNGRIGRLWQTKILQQWEPIFGGIPVETIVHARQQAYYEALNSANTSSSSTPFIEFMLEALLEDIKKMVRKSINSVEKNKAKTTNTDQVTDQVSDQVTDQVKRLIIALNGNEMQLVELKKKLHLTHGPTFRENYLNPALLLGLIERTDPASPRSPKQRYRLTVKGHEAAAR